MSYKVKRTVKKSHYDSAMTKVLYSPGGTASGKFFSSDLFLQTHKGPLLKNHSKNRVVVLQKIGIADNCWKLWSGNDHYDAAKAAFEAIEATLSPILINGSEICLTKDILTELILPRPLHPDEMLPHIMNVMQRGSIYSHGQSKWLEIIQTLLNNFTIVPEDVNDRLRFIADLHANSIKYTMNRALLSVPLVAVPTVTPSNPLEDDEASKNLWVLFREGALNKLSLSNASAWLTEAIEKHHLKCVLNLVLSRFNTNEQLCVFGNTALHAAVKIGNLTMVKLLLAYQADPCIPNNEGKTPIDIARQLSFGKILFVLEEFNQLNKLARRYYSSCPNLPEKKNSTDSFLLSFDGGGMKSVIMCHILGAIETRMRELNSECERISSYFDYLAGTSAGAIIAALLSFNPTICGSTAGIYLYKFMTEVFGSVKKKRSDRLKEYIVDIVGESTVLSDLKQGNIIITATIANVSPNGLHLMTNYGKKREHNLPGPNERKVWEALLASSAAPTYFPAFQCFLDGGLMANNPTLVAMTDICNRSKEENGGKEHKLGFVLSLGTGYVYPPKDVKDFEVYVPGLFSVKTAESLFESSKGLLNLFNHFITETTQSNGEGVNHARAWCKCMGSKFNRLSPPLKSEVAPDMNSVELLIDLLYESEKYVLQNHVEIDEIAKTILSK